MKSNGHAKSDPGKSAVPVLLDQPSNGHGQTEKKPPTAQRKPGTSARLQVQADKTAANARVVPEAGASLTEQILMSRMIENAPTSMMFCDRDLRIRYMNSASTVLLKRIENLLPCKADETMGRSIGILFENPEHLLPLADPRNLPQHTRVRIGSGTRRPPVQCDPRPGGQLPRPDADLGYCDRAG